MKPLVRCVAAAVVRKGRWLIRTGVCAVIAQSVFGCHNNPPPASVAAAPQTPPTPPTLPTPQPSAPGDAATHGYFWGTFSIDGSAYYGEALITNDGLVRIYVGGPPGATFDAEGSRQFVGRVEYNGYEIHGTGEIVGQGCMTIGGRRLCGGSVTAAISITEATRSLLSGRVKSDDGAEAWSFRLSWPTVTYLEPATLEMAAGLYRETLATFARGHEVVVSVDAAGRLFFQSAKSGCIGNGTLTPHGDGAFNVYHVVLIVENCDPAYGFGNGEFEGLATRSIGGPWDEWGDWLLIWASGAAPSPTAFAMWASRL